jgi:hypothetical protein
LPKRILAFRSRVVDDLRIAAGTTIPAGTSFSFFTNYGDLDEEKVTGVSEPDILRDLLSSDARNLILEELGVSSDCPMFFEVKNPVVQFGEKPGDIDLLICSEGRADKAIGIQCKRVKVEALDQNEDKCNKISSIAGGVRQANLQRRNFGFHQNYVAIIIETYGRLRDKSNTVFRGPTSETFNEIYNITQDESLDEEVGILFLKITQPTGKSWRRMQQVSVCVDKPASCLDQTARLTNRVSELLGASSKARA